MPMQRNLGYAARRSLLDANLCAILAFALGSVFGLLGMIAYAPLHPLEVPVLPKDVWFTLGEPLAKEQIEIRVLSGLFAGLLGGAVAWWLAWNDTPRREPFLQFDENEPHLYYDQDATRDLSRRLYEEAGFDAERGLYLAPHLALPRSTELKSIMLVGAPNSGKSNIIRAIADQAIARKDRVVLLCNKGDVAGSFTAGGAILVAAHHADSFAWDIAADVDDVAAAMQFAADIIPQSTPPFWSDSARVVLTDLIMVAIATHGPHWTAKVLLNLVLMDSNVIRQSLAKIPLNASPLILSANPDEDDRTVTGILITMRSAALVALRPLAWAWDGVGQGRRFSVKRWLSPDYRGSRTLIVQYSPDYAALSTLVAGGLIRRIATRLADPQTAIDPGRRVVMVLDEFHLLDRIENLDTALAVGREKGLVVVLGIQNTAQLVVKYGEDLAKVLLGLFQIKIYGRLTPGEPTDRVAETLGSRQVSTLLLNRSGVKGTGRYVEKNDTRPVFGAARLASELGVFSKADKMGEVRALVHAYGQVYLLAWPFTTWRQKREGFKPASWLKRLPASNTVSKSSP